METKNTMYLMAACFIVFGIILYFIYKAVYERNLNRVLQHKKVRKLPSIWLILLLYSICAFLVIGLYANVHEEEVLTCSEDNDSLIMMADEDGSLGIQLSSWMFDHNGLRMEKQTDGTNYELYTGNSFDGEFIFFVTYRLHGINPSDEITMKVQNNKTNIVIAENNFKNSFLQSGDRIYFFINGKTSEDYGECGRDYMVTVSVKGKEKLTEKVWLQLKIDRQIRFTRFTSE